MRSVVRVHLSPLDEESKETEYRDSLEKGKTRIRGGVAQLGEHLPCKQGVKSSNLSISTRQAQKCEAHTYLENRILNKKN